MHWLIRGMALDAAGERFARLDVGVEGDRIAALVPAAAPDAADVELGPHCNASTLAALRLAQLGYPVKEMLGGYDYWVHDGYPVTSGPA